MLFKDTLQINSHITDTFKTFELMDIHFRTLQFIRVLLIYRPLITALLCYFLKNSHCFWTRLLCDREQYVNQCYVVINLIESLKSSYYTDIINEHSSDQNILFKTVGKLLQKSTNKRYPPSSNDTALANSFADFFTSKIDEIHHGLVERKIRIGSSDVTVCGAEFCNFAEVTQEEIKKFSRKSLFKSCELDPLPAVVLKTVLSFYFLLLRGSSICPYRPVLCLML